MAKLFQKYWTLYINPHKHICAILEINTSVNEDIATRGTELLERHFTGMKCVLYYQQNFLISLLIVEVSRTHSVGLLWMRDQPIAETST